MKRHERLAELLHEVSTPSTQTQREVPAIESLDVEQAISDAANLTRACAETRAVREAAVASGQIQFNLESLHDALSVLNARDGVDHAQFELATIAVEAQCTRLMIEPVSFGIESSAFTQEAPRHTVSLEELEEVIKVIDSNHEALTADAADATDGVCEALKSALPNAAARLEAYLASIEKAGPSPGEPVSGLDIANCLMNGDNFPEDFEGYINNYIELGKKLAGPYLKDCPSAAANSKAFENIDFSSPEAFTASATQAFEKSVDPRATLVDVDYETCLPGDGPLFADTDGCPVAESESSVFVKMDEFVHCRQPMDPDDFTPDAPHIPDELPALSREQIEAIGIKLHALAMECDPAQLQEDCAEEGRELDSVIEIFGKKFQEASEDVQAALSGDAAIINEYLQTVQTLTRWTPQYFFTNLIQTINAFLVYAERSMAGATADISEAPMQTTDTSPSTENAKPAVEGATPPGGETTEGDPAQSGNEKPGENKVVDEAPAPGGGEAPDTNKPVTSALGLSGNEVPAGGNPPAEPLVDVDANKVTDLPGGKTIDVSTEDAAATPAPAPATTESTPSTEAAFRLRAGMKVKYSGGYGKIVKVFDRPTKYKGEIHHCSKDNPKYEVRSDVGNKLSLHKASALTVL